MKRLTTKSLISDYVWVLETCKSCQKLKKNYQWKKLYFKIRFSFPRVNGTPNSDFLKTTKTITYFPKMKVYNILDDILDDLLWNGNAVIMWRLDYT